MLNSESITFVPNRDRRTEAVRLIAEAYEERPHLSLTCRQAARLWALEPSTCADLLAWLVEVNWLVRRPDGVYTRNTAGTGLEDFMPSAGPSSGAPHRRSTSSSSSTA